jgi:hypothetical protein
VVPVDIVDAGIEAFTRIEAVQDLPPRDKMGIRNLNDFHFLMNACEFRIPGVPGSYLAEIWQATKALPSANQLRLSDATLEG